MKSREIEFNKNNKDNRKESRAQENQDDCKKRRGTCTCQEILDNRSSALKGNCEHYGAKEIAEITSTFISTEFHHLETYLYIATKGLENRIPIYICPSASFLLRKLIPQNIKSIIGCHPKVVAFGRNFLV